MKEVEYSIELFEEYDNINFYTIRLKGDVHTEAEKFLLKFLEGCKFDKDIDVILSWLEKISEKGALERYFKPEGKYGDGVCAIPIEIGNNVRLYCLRLSDNVLIIGNGDIKDADTWQNSSTLSQYVQLLIETSRFIHSRKQNGQMRIRSNKILEGNLKFTIHEKE
ncbi:hypothetical protein AAAZ42_19925 [Bacteroides ovatus]|jgi:hypothetical protein|uniref:hypothetical protein n=1 Tax=Bacteroides ovatus TaxID=28116 RepID=UPI002480C5B4|nr:hypothetical protein [Bacteroides ovatus]MDC2381288.1 hypothetical protein [Bacteroides ovatus]